MKLTKNVTEQTTIEMNKWLKQDLLQLSKKTNIEFDNLINIAIASILHDNIDYFRTDIVKGALCQFLEGDGWRTELFESPFIKVEASSVDDGESYMFITHIFDNDGTLIDQSKKIFSWDDTDGINDYLEHLSYSIPFESEVMQKYLADRLSYFPSVKGGF